MMSTRRHAVRMTPTRQFPSMENAPVAVRKKELKITALTNRLLAPSPTDLRLQPTVDGASI